MDKRYEYDIYIDSSSGCIKMYKLLECLIIYYRNKYDIIHNFIVMMMIMIIMIIYNYN